MGDYIFEKDLLRYFGGKEKPIRKFCMILKSRALKGLMFYRLKEKTNNRLIKKIVGSLSRYYFRKDGNEIHCISIGAGIVLAHPYCITINPKATLGENVTIFKGVTIGSIRSGYKEGVPQIGNNVTICCNAFVCGNIRIGDNVLIAANSFVNFDVPDNSVVLGNPGTIHYKENASYDYL